jgi:hypothetical protein
LPTKSELNAATAAANRELTRRIGRLTWIARIVSVVAGLAVAAVLLVILLAPMSEPGGGRRTGGRMARNLVVVAVVGGFLIPFFAARAFFSWFGKKRRAAWIAELAEKHGVDPEKLRKFGDALSELA